MSALSPIDLLMRSFTNNGSSISSSNNNNM